MSAFIESQKISERTPIAGEAPWLTSLRANAGVKLLASGLPHSKTEAWRFTSIRSLTSQAIGVALGGEEQDSVVWAKNLLGEDKTLRVFLVNGRQFGAVPSADGISITSLAAELESNAAALESRIGKLAHSDFFSGLNAALFSDGVVLRVASTYRGAPIHIVHITSGESACYPRVLVEAGENSQFTLVESYLCRDLSASLCTVVSEVYLEEGAHLEHVRVMESNETSAHVGTLAVVQQKDSHYTSRSIAMGGKLARLEIDARMVGPGATCHLDGMYHAIGGEHIAHHTQITHQSHHSDSREEYRGLVDDRAHAVFDGIIVVDRGTKGTSAHQENHNLLLSNNATVNTKPHLEIDSDDLSASHGATVGSVDPDQLFFLRARGIDETHARSILTFSFVRSILDRISSEPVRARLIAALVSRLPYGDEIAELAK